YALDYDIDHRIAARPRRVRDEAGKRELPEPRLLARLAAIRGLLPLRAVASHAGLSGAGAVGAASGAGIPTAALTARPEDWTAAGHALPALRADRLAGAERHPARRALAAAVATAGRIVDALEIAQHRHRIAVGTAQFDDLAEAATKAAGAARALAELAAAEHD